MRKRVFGYMRTAKTQSSLRIHAVDQGLHCPLKESLDTTECWNGEQRLGQYLAQAQDLNLRIFCMFEDPFSLDAA